VKRCRTVVLLASLALAGGCVTPADELGGLANQAPLDCAVLVTGGAFLAGGVARGTFALPATPDAEAPLANGASGPAADEPVEVIPIEGIADVLVRGNVFQRVAVDPDPVRRRGAGALVAGRGHAPDLIGLLERARGDGFDYLLVVEALEDGPIDVQGTNGRWPVTFATWILLGVGAFIPDRTFESRATLRVTLRELQMGRVVHLQLLEAGPVDLALTERTDFWGLLSSIVVPPFWVGDDAEVVADTVRATTQRRLLLSLARELKTEQVRQSLREGSAATIVMSQAPEGYRVTVDSGEGLTVARLRSERQLDAAVANAFTASLLGSVRTVGGRFQYTAVLPDAARGQRVQVLVASLRGGVASATFRPEGRR
jgi:hypothetical protein